MDTPKSKEPRAQSASKHQIQFFLCCECGQEARSAFKGIPKQCEDCGHETCYHCWLLNRYHLLEERRLAREQEEAMRARKQSVRPDDLV